MLIHPHGRFLNPLGQLVPIMSPGSQPQTFPLNPSGVRTMIYPNRVVLWRGWPIRDGAWGPLVVTDSSSRCLSALALWTEKERFLSILSPPPVWQSGETQGTVTHSFPSTNFFFSDQLKIGLVNYSFILVSADLLNWICLPLALSPHLDLSGSDFYRPWGSQQRIPELPQLTGLTLLLLRPHGDHKCSHNPLNWSHYQSHFIDEIMKAQRVWIVFSRTQVKHLRTLNQGPEPSIP